MTLDTLCLHPTLPVFDTANYIASAKQKLGRAAARAGGFVSWAAHDLATAPVQIAQDMKAIAAVAYTSAEASYNNPFPGRDDYTPRLAERLSQAAQWGLGGAYLAFSGSRMKTKVATILAASAAASLLSGCGTEGSSQGPQTTGNPAGPLDQQHRVYQVPLSSGEGSLRNYAGEGWAAAGVSHDQYNNVLDGLNTVCGKAQHGYGPFAMIDGPQYKTQTICMIDFNGNGAIDGMVNSGSAVPVHGFNGQEIYVVPNQLMHSTATQQADIVTDTVKACWSPGGKTIEYSAAQGESVQHVLNQSGLVNYMNAESYKARIEELNGHGLWANHKNIVPWGN